ncbi:hypothetical protein H0R92_01415 [Treponema sp. OMZ 840]|uniref:hypothetical protein n=1 Tax=Treponema sp. OMZ 840 TaxID=244313 RepID=UPI003D90B1E0
MKYCIRCFFFFCAFFVFSYADKAEEQTSGFFIDGTLFEKKGSALFPNGSLRRHFDESERFLIDKNGMHTLRCADNIIVQKKLDSSYRLIKKIIWKPSAAEPVFETDYFYTSDSLFPERAETTDRENAVFIREFYGEKKRLLKRETYESTDKKLICSETIRYDMQDRIAEQTVVYAQPGKRSEKTEYRYGKGGDKADILYYRGGIKIKEKTYTSDTSWKEVLYFPDNIKIVTVYKDETPVWEIFYKNDEKKRERAL